jgi:Ulp1 family protease
LPKEYLMELLYQNKWANNFVIDAYLELLTKKNPNFGYVPTYVVTYFRKDGIIIPNWFQSITLEHMPKIEYWLIPAHINNNHWALAVFGVSINFMTFYDSLYTGIAMEEKNEFKEDILKFFKMLYHEKNMGDMPFDVNITGWLDISNVPKQENAIDCGVFLMIFAEDIVNHKAIFPEMTVNQKKIYECRMKIFNELAAEKL